jgi:serine/threonine-protein kinase
LQRCLQKDPQRRLRDIGDARLELEEALAAPRGLVRASPAAHPSRVALFALGGLLVGAAIAGGVAWNLSRKTPAAIAGFTIRLGPNEFLPRLGGMAFSPDGTSLAYLVARGGQQQLYLRRMSDSEATIIPHTEGIAGVPVFSPDGRWLAFWQDAKWKKVTLSGGPPAPMFDAPPGGAMMASWGPDDSLVFGVAPASLARVPAAGGTLQYLSVIDPQKMERWGGEPQFLPDGKTVLFGLRTSDVDAFNDYRIAAYSLDTMQRKILVDGGTKATYLRSRHLVYVRAGTLLAVPFDLAKLAVTGPAVPVLNDVYENAVDGTAQFAVSASGSLAYAPGGQVAGA